ncbi:hypothetical protein [Desertivirga xinjiangensis]|uniref:hypothetical protein n=1 Tax=Desertivirga xinjiangensis TaxID=539206 RepID=UPI00210E3A5E|nr:hypothetical protein [Pedobacter xinjiangensis]
MDSTEFNYRQHVIYLYVLCHYTSRELYICGLNFGIQNELKDMFEVFGSESEIPVDMAILEALDNPSVKILIKMIEALTETMNSLANINSLTDEELEQAIENWEGLEHSGEIEPPEENTYSELLSKLPVFIYATMCSFYIRAWQLVHYRADVPDDLYDSFQYPYVDNIKFLEGPDSNMQLLCELFQKMHDLDNEILNEIG